MGIKRKKGSVLEEDMYEVNFIKARRLVKGQPEYLVRHRNRSGVIDLVGREPLVFAEVENGVTKSCQNFRRKNKKKQFWPDFSTFLSRIACCSRESTSA